MGYGSTASPKRKMGYDSMASPRLGMGYGSTASPKRGTAPWLPLGWGRAMAPRLPQCLGWAMAPRLPQRGDGLWLHCFPKVGDQQMPIGWVREGCAPAVCIFGRGYGKAHCMYFWEGHSPKRGLHGGHPRPSRNATGSHAGLWRGYRLASVGEGRRGRDGNAICEKKIGRRCMPSVVETWNYIV